MSRLQNSPGSLAKAAVRTPKVGSLVVAGLAAVLLIASLLAPGWLHVPANPAAGTPATTLDFQDLNELTGVVPTTGWQEAYFSWLGWTLVVLAIAVAAVALLRPSVVSAGAQVMTAFVGLVSTLFGVKGPLTWSQFVDATDQVRIGVYMLDLGFFALLVVGIAQLVALRRGR